MFEKIQTQRNEWQFLEDVCGELPEKVKRRLNLLDPPGLRKVLQGDFRDAGPFLAEVRDMIAEAKETTLRGIVGFGESDPMQLVERPKTRKPKKSEDDEEDDFLYFHRVRPDLNPSAYISSIMRRYADSKYAEIIQCLRKPFAREIYTQLDEGFPEPTGTYFEPWPISVDELKNSLRAFLDEGDSERSHGATLEFWEIFARLSPDWIRSNSTVLRVVSEWTSRNHEQDDTWKANHYLGVATDFWGTDVEYLPLNKKTNRSFYLSTLKLACGIVSADLLWPEEHSLLFILCGITPPSGSLKAKYTVRQDLPCLSRITISVMPTTPEAEVMEIYAELKRKLLGGKQVQKVTNQKMAVASFVYGWKGSFAEVEDRVTADKGEWRNLMDQWNIDACPKESWKYDYPSRFEADARAGYKYLAAPELTAPRSYVNATRGQTEEDLRAEDIERKEAQQRYWIARQQREKAKAERARRRGALPRVEARLIEPSS